MMVTFTPAQTIAIREHQKNIIVSAGAGSGKTHVLVERFLALLEDNPTWHLHNIVAITFTRKAADEMRDRVRQKLEERYHQKIAENQPDIAQRWASWLGEIDGAQIDTIHGLCTNLLRANFAEAGLDPEFAVLDEIQAGLLLDQAIQTTFLALKAHYPPAPELDLFALYGENRVLSIIRDMRLLAMNAQPNVDSDAMYKDLLDIHSAHILQVADRHNAHDWYDDDERWHLVMDMLEALRNGTDDDQKIRLIHAVGKLNFSGKRIEDPTTKAFVTIMRDHAKALIEHMTKWDEARHIGEHAPATEALWQSLIKRVKTAYEALKADLAVLDFDDLERRTHTLLQNRDIINRYRHKEIMHLMVDEFQDTNMTQWGIIEALGGGDASHITFLVGDDKQSIYGFRGGDVSVFNRVKTKIIATLGENPALNKSFRTQSALIHWFNRLFKQVMMVNPAMPQQIQDFMVDYGTEMEAHRQSKYDHPPVRLLLINDHTVNETNTALSKDERRKWEAMAIADEIQTIIAQKLPVWDKKLGEYRPVQYRDITILFRRMTHIGIYENALRMFGVPYITVAGKGYYDRQEVWDLINLLQAVYNPYDELALVSALRSPLFHVSDDALLALRLYADDHNLRLWEAIGEHDALSLSADDHARLAHADAVIDDLRGQMGRRTLADVLRHAIYKTDYIATISSLPDGDRQRGNIEKLLEKADGVASLSLGDFVTYWHHLNDKEVREGDAPLEVGNAVTLMTIHASKGLEYPVVFIPDAQTGDRGDYSPVIYESGGYFGCKVMLNGEATPTLGYHWVNQLNKERANAESLRLLYVATTRAGDYLYISGLVNQKKEGISYAKSDGGWLRMIIEALNMTDIIRAMLEAHKSSMTAGDTHLLLPQNRPTPPKHKIDKSDTLWDADFTTIAPTPLRLLTDVVIEKTAPARHLAATTLADLGGAEHNQTYGDIFAQRFRQRVFHDAPNRIPSIVTETEHTTSQRIGEVVHEALRHGHLPNKTDSTQLNLILQNYAWRFGVRGDTQAVIGQALKLLRQFEKSHIYQTIEHAKTVYRELPFVFKWDDHIIHGVIDVLCKTDTGWMIYDYKTSTVADGDCRTHAPRYYLQLAIYAHAVEKHIGILPESCLYYIRYNQAVPVSQDILRAELQTNLTDRILKMER